MRPRGTSIVRRSLLLATALTAGWLAIGVSDSLSVTATGTVQNVRTLPQREWLAEREADVGAPICRPRYGRASKLTNLCVRN